MKYKPPYSICSISYIIGRWNPDKLRVEYLNTRGHWVLNMSPITARFTKGWNDTVVQHSNTKKYQVFSCKVFLDRKSRCIKLTKPNHWHKMEAMMSI